MKKFKENSQNFAGGISEELPGERPEKTPYETLGGMLVYFFFESREILHLFICITLGTARCRSKCTVWVKKYPISKRKLMKFSEEFLKQFLESVDAFVKQILWEQLEKYFDKLL